MKEADIYPQAQAIISDFLAMVRKRQANGSITIRVHVAEGLPKKLEVTPTWTDTVESPSKR